MTVDIREYIIPSILNENILMEGGASEGDDLERAVVDIINGKTKLPYSQKIQDQAKRAISKLPKNIKFAWRVGSGGENSISIKKVKGVKGNVKTDIFLDSKNNPSNPKFKVSVKMAGKIQLQSSNLDTTYDMFKEVAASTLKNNKGMKANIKKAIIEATESLKDKHGEFVDIKNLEAFKHRNVFMDDEKAKKLWKTEEGRSERKAYYSKFLSKNLKTIKEEYDYDVWEEKYKDLITNATINALNSSKEFKHDIIEEMITGKLTFKDSPLGIANSILTPDEFHPKITPDVVEHYANSVRFVVGAKSINKISFPTFRAIAEGAKSAGKKAADSVKKKLSEEFDIDYIDGEFILNEGFFDKVKEFGENIWNKIKDFFREIIESITKAVKDFYISKTDELSLALIEDGAFEFNMA